MNAFCTYCSKEKSQESGDIPAIYRYQSSRIESVFAAASSLGIEFYIVSGKFGLVHSMQPIQYYDYLLETNEVSALAKLIVSQIYSHRVTKIVYFTKPLISDRKLIPYYDCLKIATEQVALPFFVIEL
jgi:hypothetical protein